MGQSPCSCDRSPAVNTQTITGDDEAGAAAASVSEADAGGGGASRQVLEGNATYEGGWLNGQKHGNGVLTGKDGAKYVGQFKHDKKEGQGVYYYPSGAKYTGQWANDMQEGHGKEEWADGSVFEGDFKAGWADGFNEWAEGMTTCDGRGYSGRWTHNTMGPSGKMWWSDGRTYIGEFLDGRKHGEGTLTWPDGRSYCGQWQDGKQHGNAVAQTAKGLKRQSVMESLYNGLEGSLKTRMLRRNLRLQPSGAALLLSSPRCRFIRKGAMQQSSTDGPNLAQLGKKRLHELDWFRALMVILVVYAHISRSGMRGGVYGKIANDDRIYNMVDPSPLGFRASTMFFPLSASTGQ
eukprot:g2635.t1